MFNYIFNIENTFDAKSLAYAAIFFSSEEFNAYIEKFPALNLNISIVQQGHFYLPNFLGIPNGNGWTPLHLTARNQSEASFCKLLDKISVQALNAAVAIQDKHGWNPLHCAAQHQNREAFCALIDKADNLAIDAALIQKNENEDTPLSIAVQCQSKEAVCKLIDKASKQAISDEAKSIKQDWNTLHIAAQNQAKEAFLKHMEKTETKTLNTLALITSRKFSAYGTLPNLLGLTLKYQSPYVVNQLIQNLDFDVLEKNIMTNKDLFKKIYLPCFRCPSFKLIQDGEKLILLNSLYADLKIEPIVPSNDPHFNYVLEKIKEGNVLLKTIKSKHWEDSLKQIYDKKFRPPLREKKKDFPYKFSLSSGTVEERKEGIKNDEYTHSRKWPTTLLSQDMLTAVFGEHDEDRELVGLLLDGLHCELKALLAIDLATHYKPWAKKSLEDAKNYGAAIQSHHFLLTHYQDFKERVNQNPFIHNEVMAKIPYDKLHEVLLAIVIAKNTKRARLMARHRQYAIKKLLNLEIPIVFYNRYLGQTTFYTPIKMQKDGIKDRDDWIKFFQLDLTLSSNLIYWQEKTAFNEWGGGEPIQLDGLTYKIPQGILKIMQAVHQYKHLPEMEFFQYIESVDQTLDKSFSLLRSHVTQHFYHHGLKLRF